MIMPIARHPSTFAARVPIGHSIENPCAAILKLYRAIDPVNPPRPTSKDMANGCVIASSLLTTADLGIHAEVATGINPIDRFVENYVAPGHSSPLRK